MKTLLLLPFQVKEICMLKKIFKKNDDIEFYAWNIKKSKFQLQRET